MATVYLLDLSDQGIEALRPLDFAGLSSLTRLSLNDNQLSALPVGVFADLFSLTDLALGFNRFSELPSGLFAGLTSLTRLGLQYNQLSRLPAGLFEGLTSLAFLELSSNPGAPFRLTLEPKQRGGSAFVARVVEGAPFAMTTTVTVSGGTAADSVTVPAGAVVSEEIALEPEADGPVTVTFGAAPMVPANFQGIEVAVGGPAVLEDFAGPTLESAGAGGDRLVLIYDEALDETSAPAPGAFSVTVADSSWNVTDVSVVGSQVALTLASSVAEGQAVALSYTVPTTGAIRDSLGNVAAGFVDREVTVDATDPILTEAAVVGDRLVLTYDEALDEASTPAPGAFSAAVADSLRGVAGVSIAGMTVTLTLASPVAAGETVTLNYTVPGVGAIRDWVGNPAAALVGVEVGNDTPGICGRTAAVEAAILGRISGVDDCADVIESHLAAIADLDLSNQDIETLRAGDFAGLTSLAELNLGGNRLSEMPAGVFDGLASLTYLNLINNRLGTLPERAFADLSSLSSEELILGANRLSELPEEAFVGLGSLTELQLHGNRLSELPAGVFAGVSSLTSLELNRNPGAPFRLTMEPESGDGSAFLVKVAEGAPFAMTTTVTVAGGTAADSVTVPAGSLVSDEIAVTPDRG